MFATLERAQQSRIHGEGKPSHIHDEGKPSGATDDTPDNTTDALPEAPLNENPFDSESSRILFDAIDQLQSCDAGQDVDIPQVSLPSARCKMQEIYT